MKSIFLCLFLLSGVTRTAHSQLWKNYADTARTARMERKPAIAADYYLKSLHELKKDSLGTYTYGITCMSLGTVYINLFENDKAKIILEEAKKVLQKINEQPAVSDVCDNLGNMYRNISLYDEAEKAYSESKDIREKIYGRYHRFYAISCDNLGILYEITGRYNEAFSLLTEARNIFSNNPGKESRSYAVNADNLGLLNKTTGRFAEAEKYMTESFGIWKKISGEESLDFGVMCNNLGLLYREMGEYEKSESILLTAKKIREQILGKQHPSYALVCNNLGGLYDKMGQALKAEQYLLEARKVYEKNKNQFNYSVNCESLGLLYSKTDSIDKALVFLQDCYESRKKLLGVTHFYTVNALMNIGGLYLKQKKIDLIEPIFIEVKNTYDNILGQDSYGYAEICTNLAWIYYLTKRSAEAEKLGMEALYTVEKNLGRENLSYPLFANNMAIIYQDLGKDKKADSLFHEAFAATRRRMEKVFQFTSEYEKQSYLQTLVGDRDMYYSFRYDRLPFSEAGECYDRSIYFRNLILSSTHQLNKNIYDKGDSAITRKYNEWKSIRQQLAYWLIKPETEQTEEKTLLEEKSNVLEKELTRLSTAFGKQQQQKEINWEKIKAALKQGEAAIEFSEFAWYDERVTKDSIYYLAFIIEKGMKEPFLVKLFEKRKLNSLLKRKSVNEKNKINQLYSSTELYELIWAPLEKYLDGVKTIYFAPSGLLNYVSMAAIKINDNKLLSDQYQLVQLLNTVSVTDSEEEQLIQADKLVLYGGVQYDADSVSLVKEAIPYQQQQAITRSIPEEILLDNEQPVFLPLPKTESEVMFIEKEATKKKMSVQVLKGSAANEESFKSLNGKNSPSLIHFATHGFFYPDTKRKRVGLNDPAGRVFKLSDNPLLRSGLVLSGASNTWKGKPVTGIEDGILTGYEVANMYLPNTKLVVLSACRTGLGDIQGTEGVYGLQRAFKIAGVKNIVMSLWDVDDNAGAEFMQLFYTDLLRKGNISASFRKAQDMMKLKYPGNPYIWAAFIMIR